VWPCPWGASWGWAALLLVFKHQKAPRKPFPCYKRVKYSRKYQPWIVKVKSYFTSKTWMTVETFSFILIFYVASLASAQI
jgi:hypothetical protein